ncbi:hypothetical protein Tco_0629550 [Tanacetum coccineum]|uniref:Uncharacterized protein n=1 Tax=Tanacetum coccineum TaxID=301880 RepID=A0ABQ4WTK5_9ASTR
MIPATTPLLGFSGEISWPLGANITNGDSRRWRALNKRPDELHGRQIPVTIQWYHRSPRHGYAISSLMDTVYW